MPHKFFGLRLPFMSVHVQEKLDFVFLAEETLAPGLLAFFFNLDGDLTKL